MGDRHDLPFTVEYAKSGRASCKGCKVTISKDTLRMGIMVQSPHFDGKIPNWFHSECFWGKARVKSIGDIHGFDNLRWEDQELVRNKVEGSDSSSGGASKSKDEFSIEYAKSGRSGCKGCESKIAKDEIRISCKEYESKSAQMTGGGVPQWFHMECFSAKADELGFNLKPEKIPGFSHLKPDDQEIVKKKVKPNKKRKGEKAENGVVAKAPKVDENKEKLKKQSEELWKIKDNLDRIPKKILSELLECNGQQIPKGESKIKECLADCMYFGALKPCESCGDGQFVYSTTEHTYLCTGDATEWTKCQVRKNDPPRQPFDVPEDFKEESPFLREFKFKEHSRILPADIPEPSSAKAESKALSPPPPSKPLQHLKFVISGKIKGVKALKDKIRAFGATLPTSVGPDTTAVVTTKEEFEKNADNNLLTASSSQINVVSTDFVDLVEAKGAEAALKECKLNSVGGEFHDLIHAARHVKSAAAKKEKEDLSYTKSVPKSQKLVVKGGAAVDPDSEKFTSRHRTLYQIPVDPQ